MVHSVLRWIRQVYLGVAFAGYMLAFLVAFTMVFMLPIGAFAMLFLALMALVPVAALLSLIKAAERRLALRKLSRGTCPACGAAALSRMAEGSDAAAVGGMACGACSMRFNGRGEDMDTDAPAERAVVSALA